MLLVPISHDSGIAAEYMEDYIRIIEEERKSKIKIFLVNAGLFDCKLNTMENMAIDAIQHNTVKWGQFNISNLFTGQTGNVDIQRKHLNGKGTWYINSGVTDFGIIGKTDYPAKIFQHNTLTVDMFGNSYYRDFDYKMATHAHVFSLTHTGTRFNENIGLFCCTAMGYFKKMYSFSDMCSWNKMKVNKIMLPVTDDGKIDYDFIETFISAQKKLILQGKLNSFIQ